MRRKNSSWISPPKPLIKIYDWKKMQKMRGKIA